MNATTLSRLSGTSLGAEFTVTETIGDAGAGTFLRTLVSRRRVLAATRSLLRTESYGSFSMERIASLSGVARRTVYNLFPDRDALYRSSRTDLLDEFEHLLAATGPTGDALRADLEVFGRRALTALGTTAHGELLASVRRDEGIAWIACLYRDRVTLPLCRTLEAVLAAHAVGDAESRARHAQAGFALLRAAIGESNCPPVLDSHEFAWIMAARIGVATAGEIGRPAEETSLPDFAAPLGSEHRPMIRRGAVTITFNPILVTWNDRHVPLSPLEARLFAMVARRGRAAWAEIDQLLDVQRARTNTREVLLFRLRRKFAEIGATDPLATVRGWGLRFRTEADSSGSRTVWIGAREEAIEA